MKKHFLICAGIMCLSACGQSPTPTSSETSSSSQETSSESSSSESSQSSSSSIDTGERLLEISKATGEDFLTDEPSSFSCYELDDHGQERLLAFEDAYAFGDSIGLKENGFIKNTTPLFSLESITAVFDGSLTLYSGNSTSDITSSILTSGSKVSFPLGSNFFKVAAANETHLSSLSLSFKKEGSITKREIRLYKADYVSYSSKEYDVGSTVDPSSWEKPSYKHEGQDVPFKAWLNESETIEVKNPFSMPDKSLAFYPSYVMPQLFNWTFDPDTSSYISKGSGVRPAKGLTGQFGDLKANVEINTASCTGVGLIFNAVIPETDYPYDYRDGCSYMYFHLNPNNGGIQFAIVNGSYDAKKTVTLAGAPLDWQEKWNSWNNGGRTSSLTFEMEIKSEFTQTSIIIDGNLIYSYPGQTGLKATAMGMRTNAAGIRMSDFRFEEYHYSYSTKNGYLIDDDKGTYTAMAANATFAPSQFKGRHARFSADVTWNNKNSTNVRTGIFLNHGIKESENTVLVSDATNTGYYMHHNPYVNANFTATMYTAGTYAKHPNGTTGNIGSKTYNASTTGALGEYYAANRAFFDGEEDSLTLNYQMELTATYIALSVNGEEIYRSTNASLLGLFDSDPSCLGAGFTTSVAGTVFSNLKFEVLE